MFECPRIAGVQCSKHTLANHLHVFLFQMYFVLTWMFIIIYTKWPNLPLHLWQMCLTLTEMFDPLHPEYDLLQMLGFQNILVLLVP